MIATSPSDEVIRWSSTLVITSPDLRPAFEADRRPDRADPLPDLEARGVSQRGRDQVLDALGLDHGGVGERVGAEHLGAGVGPVVEADAQTARLACEGDDVVVGEDLAVLA